MPIVILSGDGTYEVLSSGPSLDIEFFSGIGESAVSTDTELFLGEAESEGPELTITLTDVAFSALGVDVELDYPFGHVTDVDLRSIFNSDQATHKLVTLSSQYDDVRLYNMDFPDPLDGIANYSPFNRVGHLNNSRINMPGEVRTCHIAQCPNGNSVLLSRSNDTIKVMSPTGETIYQYKLNDGIGTKAVTIAANDNYLYCLIWKGCFNGSEESIPFDSSWDDRWSLEQRYLSNGQIVEFDWYDIGVQTDTYFPENSYQLETESYINYGAPFLLSDVLLLSSAELEVDVDLQAIENALNLDLLFSVDSMLEVDVDLKLLDALETDVEFFIAEVVSEIFESDCTLVTWDYVQTYSSIDIGFELIVSDCIETDADIQLLESYVETDVNIWALEMQILEVLPFTVPPSTGGTVDGVMQLSHSDRISHHRVVDGENVTRIRYSKYHSDEIGIIEANGKDKDEIVRTDGYSKPIPLARDTTDSPSMGDGRDCLNVRMVATNNRLFIVGSHPRFNKYYDDIEGVWVGPWAFSDYLLDEINPDKRNTFCHIAEYDLETLWVKKNGLNRLIPNMSCTAGFDANDETFVMSEFVIPDPYDNDACNMDIVAYDLNGTPLWNYDGYIDFKVSPILTNPTIWQDVKLTGCVGYGLNWQGSLRITEYGTVVYGFTSDMDEGTYKHDQHILFPSWNRQDKIMLRGKPRATLLSVNLMEFPRFIEVDADFIAQSAIGISGDAELVGLSLSENEAVQTDLLFSTDNFISVDLSLEDSNDAVMTDVFLGDVGYRERVVIVSTCTPYDLEKPMYTHRSIARSQMLGFETYNYSIYTLCDPIHPRKGNPSFGTYPFSAKFWERGIAWRSENAEAPPEQLIDRPAWLISDDWATWENFFGYDSLNIETMIQPIAPVQYESDTEEGLLFGIWNKYDNDKATDWKYYRQPLVTDKPDGVLFKISDPNSKYDNWVNLPGRLLDSYGNETFSVFRKICLDKTNKKIYVIRAEGKLDYRGYWNSSYTILGTTRIYNSKNLKAEAYSVSEEELGYYEDGYYFQVYDQWITTPVHQINEYTSRDFLIYDYDLNYMSSLSSIRGLDDDDVVIHFYEKNRVYYILTQVKETTPFQKSVYMNDTLVETFAEDVSEQWNYYYQQYTYKATRLYKLSGYISTGIAELLYEVPYACSSLDSMMIQEVTDTHVWINWDGINPADNHPLNGVGFRIDGKGKVEVPLLQSIMFNENTNTWELAVVRARPLGVPGGDCCAYDSSRGGRIRALVDCDGYGNKINKFPVGNHRYNLRYPGTFPDREMWDSKSLIFDGPSGPITIEGGIHYDGGGVDIIREDNFEYIREELAVQQRMNDFDVFDMNEESYTYPRHPDLVQGSYPSVSRVFKRKLYDWVSTDCKLVADISVSAPSTWIEIVNGGGTLDL